MPVQTAIQVRRGTASSWTSTNPTLAAGEIGFETDTSKFKIGTGSTAWNSLNYFVQDPVTTKGDLYTFSTTDTRLPVGANGETLVADSSQTTGLRYNPQNALANPIINGGFDIWQRGTSAVAGTPTGAYFADRFQIARASAGSAATRQTVSDSTNLPNIQYCARIARDSGNTSTNIIYVGQSMESVNSIPYAGKTITISFYARKGANFSGASDALSAVLVTGTGTDQSVWNGLTGSITVINQTATLTSTWQRFTFTGTLSSTLTQIGFYAFYTPSGTAGANDWFEITGFQIDLGTYTASSAPTFRRSGGTLAGELAACQRYYYRATGTQAYTCLSHLGSAETTTLIRFTLPVPAQMRVAPTAVDYSTLTSSRDGLNSGNALSAVTLSGYIGKDAIQLYGTVTGATAYSPYYIYTNNSAAGYIGVSAEL